MKCREYRQYMEPHDSFFIGSDVFYTFLVENDCWDLRIRQRTPEGYFSVAAEFQQAILKGHFPEDIREKFRKLLDYFGRSPDYCPVQQYSGGRFPVMPLPGSMSPCSASTRAPRRNGWKGLRRQ